MPVAKVVRYGIAGFGSFAERAIAPAMRAAAQSQLVAIQKRSAAAAREKAAALGIPLSFASVEELVAHPDVDAVFVASANACHYAETIAAARAGKHVLVEKPMAMNSAEAERMIHACRENGVRLMVGHVVRFSPVVRRIKEMVQTGTLGSVSFVRSEFTFDGRRSPRGWLYDRTVAGGGPVFDIAVHCLDTIRFILGDEVTSVKSDLQPLPDRKRTEETANIALRFSRNTLGSIFCSYAAPTRRSFLEVVGTDARVSAVNFTRSSVTAELQVSSGAKDEDGDTRTERITVPDLVAEEIAHFSDCILSGRESISPGENGLANQKVLDEAMRGGEV